MNRRILKVTRAVKEPPALTRRILVDTPLRQRPALNRRYESSGIAVSSPWMSAVLEERFHCRNQFFTHTYSLEDDKSLNSDS